MADEIDIETDRLEFLMRQKQNRIDEKLLWAKPVAGDSEHPHQHEKLVFPAEGKLARIKKKTQM